MENEKKADYKCERESSVLGGVGSFDSFFN